MVFEVTGPMLAVLRPAGQRELEGEKVLDGRGLVKVMRSAPSERNRSMAPVTSAVSGTVR